MNISSRLAKHFTAAATAAALVGAVNAQIAVTPINQVVPANIDGLYINVETGATGTSGSSTAGWDINPYSATALTWYNATGAGIFRLAGATTPSNAPLTTVIDSTGTFGGGSSSTSSAIGAWTLNADNYFGFKFLAADGLTHYGWGRMTIGSALTDRTMQELYWEQTAGASITVGDTGSPGTPATSLAYGSGCGASAASFYELFAATAAVDLSNTSFRMAYNGTGYSVGGGAAAYAAPSGTATNLSLGDDAETSVTLSSGFAYPGGTTTTLMVCSNGFVSVASNGTDYSPTAAEFLGWTNPAWAVWRDMIPTGADNVYFEEVGGVAYVTWLNVVGYNGSGAGITPSTFQLQFHLGTGNVDFVFLGLDTVSASNFGDAWVVGYSSAGASIDSGSKDISAGLALTLPGGDTPALALAADVRPITGTTVTYTISNIPSSAVLSALVLGIGGQTAGTDLTSVGLPGCFGYVDFNSASVNVLFGTPSATFALSVPSAASLIGLPLNGQGVTIDPAATGSAILSNAIASVLGDV